MLGDDLASIGSGVTAPDPTTFADARMVLQQHHLWDRVPRPVRDHIGRGCRGEIRDTPKPGSRVFRRVHNEIVGNNQAAVDAAANAAWNDEVTPLVLTTTLTGEAREAARAFGALARQIVDRGRPLHRPCCIIAGGELTVTVRGSGTGGVPRSLRSPLPRKSPDSNTSGWLASARTAPMVPRMRRVQSWMGRLGNALRPVDSSRREP